MKRHVLCIDDDVMASVRVEAIFENTDYDLVVAYDANEGLELAKKLKPNVILISDNLSEQGGIDLVHKIKASGLLFPEIIVVAYTLDATRQSAYEQLGIRIFVPKPFERNELPDAVRRAYLLSLRHD